MLESLVRPEVSVWLWPVVAAGAAVAVIKLISNAFFGQRSSPPRFDLKHQSKILPGPERIHAAIYGIPKGKDYLETSDDSVRTVYDAFQHGKRSTEDGECIGWRPGPDKPYSWLSYDEVDDKARKFGEGLISLGLKPGQQTFVGIYAQNCPEFLIAELGIVSNSMVIVTLYDTLGADAGSYIIQQAEISAVICDTFDKVQRLLADSKNTPTLKTIIVIKWGPKDPPQDLKIPPGIQVLSFDEVLKRKSPEASKSRNLPSKDDIYILCYTSGTTGTPKGVMLSHGAIISNVCSCDEMFRAAGVNVTPSDICMSYLPLAHMFEQTVQCMMYYRGAKVGCFQGSVKLLTDDMKTLKPTLLPVVPRILSRISDGVQAQLSKSRLKKVLFSIAYRMKWAQLKRGDHSDNTIWDHLVFSKIRAQTGGKVRLMLTGSAPIAGETLNFCRTILGCPIFEGYGQTEFNAGMTLTLAGDLSGGNVGAPMPCAHIKLVDVPELNYFAKNDQGEICARGPALMKGYYKEPEKTRETIDKDGWLHTGDIGQWDPEGRLKIIDRKKHIFKLAQGEYVAPEKIESIYVRHSAVAQIYVDGQSDKRYLIGVVVPEESALLKAGFEGSLKQLCNKKEVADWILSELQKLGKSEKLSSIEQVQKIHLSPELFSVENGLLTPTLKAKRPELKKKFIEVFNKLYAGPEPGAG